MTVLRTSIIFTVGCLVLVVNAALSFLPFVGFKQTLPKALIYVEGALSVLSCGLFLAGSIIAFLESLKATDGNGGYWGYELEDRLATDTKESQAEKGEFIENTEEALVAPWHTHFAHNNSSHAELFNPQLLEEHRIVPETPPPSYTEAIGQPTWSHVTAAHGFDMKYCNLGLIASAIFLLSSLVYTVTAIISLATIISTGEVFRAIRYPQLVGGAGFTIGSLILLFKAQKDTTGYWWKPALRRLAWHVNLLNLIGSAGFVFCALFGLLAHVHWTDFQFNCSYLWGSWAFLFGAMIQWYKARHKMKFHQKLDWRKLASTEKLRLYGVTAPA